MANDTPKPVVKKAVTPPAKPGPVKKPTMKIDSNANRVRPYREGFSNYQKTIWNVDGENKPKPTVIKIDSGAKPIQAQSSGVLGGTHMGGHSDVSAAINLGGFQIKTPIIKSSSTKNK